MKINDLIKKEEFAEDIIPENVEGLNNLLRKYGAATSQYDISKGITFTPSTFTLPNNQEVVCQIEDIRKHLTAMSIEIHEIRRILNDK